MSIWPRENSTVASHRPTRWAILLALCAINLVLLTALVSTLHLGRQQRNSMVHASTIAVAQSPSATPQPPAAEPPAHRLLPAPQRTIVLLDPAHGGPETGAQINDHLLEKDVTLALAARLRSALQSHNFTVLTTRDGDPANGLTTDQRAEIANHSAAIACIVLHATSTGNGVHLFTSALPQDASHRAVLPWATAQSAFVQQSAQLEKQISTALTHAQFTIIQAQTALAPLDNLTCPAVAVEIAPIQSAGGDNNTGVSDPAYQARVAESLATALVFWRGQNAPTASLPTSSPLLAATSHHVRITP